MNIEKIWTEYQSGIKAFLRSKISNPSDVDDMIQDLWIKTFNSLHTLKSGNSIKPWIFRITSNAIIDFYRKNGRPFDQIVEDFSNDEDSEDIQQILSGCMIPFINLLPEHSADLLIQIDIKGLSQKEYAKRHDLNYSTVKSRVQKSRNELRNLYEDCCHFSFDSYGNLTDFDPKSRKHKNCC